MSYDAIIRVRFDDTSLGRARGRVQELAASLPEWLSGAYGDDSLVVVETDVVVTGE